MQLFLQNIGFIGYGVASLFFFFFTALLATGWRGRMQGGLLLALSLMVSLWALASALYAGFKSVPAELIWSLEALRLLMILLFLIRLQEMQSEGRSARLRLLSRSRYLAVALCLFLALPFENIDWPEVLSDHFQMPNFRLLVQVLLAVSGLALVEQVYRNTPWEYRWGIKYLCLGVGLLLAFDFYLFSDALLFNQLDVAIWQARGAVNALTVPLLAISAARNPQWSLDLFVSRKVVFHTTAIFASGTYLLVMALAGYYIRLYGGEWSRVLEIVFFAGAVIVLLVLLFSGQLRSRLKVFISKHFFNYKYDYREEWLRLISILSRVDARPLTERVIYALGEVVDSPGGVLWLREDNEAGDYRQRALWNVPVGHLHEDLNMQAVAAYLGDTQWIIDLGEYTEDPEFYDGLDLPEALLEENRFWLIVPLFHGDDLLGFVLLSKARAPQKPDWESLDLLKTAGRQAASYLALEEAARALAEARQFEGFNRLSAFVVHDLKNLIAQLSLLVKNAERHKSNPEFIDDMILTIENSVGKMSRLMAQLRGAMPRNRSDRIGLCELLAEVVRDRETQLPKPRFLEKPGEEIYLFADRDRLGSVIGHVVHNAQDATGAKGRVDMRLKDLGGEAHVVVEDDGVGMDDDFIRNRLFKPFDSTKGLTGMGVGAYECREFVTSLGGRVEVSSSPGEGTSFVIILPLPESDDMAAFRH